MEFEELEEGPSINLRELNQKIEALREEIETIKSKFKIEEIPSSEELRKTTKRMELLKEELLEIRRVVLASLERMKEFEEKLPKELEALGKLERRLENDEAIFSKLAHKIREDLSRLESEKQAFTREIKERLDRIEESFEREVREEAKQAVRKQAEMLTAYGSKLMELEKKFEILKKEEIPVLLDREITKLIQNFSGHLSKLVTREDFAKFSEEVRSRIESITAPNLQNIEERLAELEDRVDKIAKLVFGLSQRLPVVVE